MGIFDFFKKQPEHEEAEEVFYEEYEDEAEAEEAAADYEEAPGWEAISTEFARIYNNRKPVDHIEAIVKWRSGGPDPLDGVDVYDAGDVWHLVSYGLSELYEKVSQDTDYSGYGFEFTLRLKKGDYQPNDEFINIVTIFQDFARRTFETGEVYQPFEYIYTGQMLGFDSEQASALTGFITVPDPEAQVLETAHGLVEFVELVGVTDAELQQIMEGQLTVQALYAQLGSDVTDYERESLV
ncbi:suppressor of fused domain protein [Streptococcus sp. DD11]|uniref:suppressor of fused domain protein n=1 Tax=Streptococcus sp. DD11 TaxID=1777879 RepID=UPI0010080EA1|nr:suppressor of fused domain protein [Streptococcus sp. DD11]